MAKKTDDLVKSGYTERVISKHVRYIKRAETASESDRHMDFKILDYEEIWDGEKWKKK